jgi:RimJ/RimL family protein N-acetyltransferase
MISFTQKFETDRILLRPMELKDFEDFVRITNDKDLWIYFINDLSDKDTLYKWVESALQELNNREKLALSIINKESKTIIGSTSIGNISLRDKRVEIGWTWICREFHGKGINDQTKYLLLKYCFDELECERVEFKTDVLNQPARRALKRIGAVEEGVLRSHTLMTHNRRRDTIYYSVLRQEWDHLKLSKYF